MDEEVLAPLTRDIIETAHTLCDAARQVHKACDLPANTTNEEKSMYFADFCGLARFLQIDISENQISFSPSVKVYDNSPVNFTGPFFVRGEVW